MRLNRKGFTLIEIMVVAAVIGLLATIAILNYIQSRQTAFITSCRNNLKMLEGTIMIYFAETETYPNQLIDLQGAYLSTVPVNCPLDAVAYQYDSFAGTVTCPNGHTP